MNAVTLVLSIVLVPVFALMSLSDMLLSGAIVDNGYGCFGKEDFGFGVGVVLAIDTVAVHKEDFGSSLGMVFSMRRDCFDKEDFGYGLRTFTPRRLDCFA